MPQAGERSTTSSNSSFKNELSFLSIFVLYLLWLGFKRHWCWGLSFLYLFYHNYIMIALLLCFEPSLDVKKVTFGTLCFFFFVLRQKSSSLWKILFSFAESRYACSGLLLCMYLNKVQRTRILYYTHLAP